MTDNKYTANINEDEKHKLQNAQTEWRSVMFNIAKHQQDKQYIGTVQLRYRRSKLTETQINEYKKELSELKTSLAILQNKKVTTQQFLQNLRGELTGDVTVSARKDPIEWGTQTPPSSDTDEDEVFNEESEEQEDD